MPGLCVSSKCTESFAGRRDRRLGWARHGHAKGSTERARGDGLAPFRVGALRGTRPPRADRLAGSPAEAGVDNLGSHDGPHPRAPARGRNRDTLRDLAL
jgi:hypothetical protein